MFTHSNILNSQNQTQYINTSKAILRYYPSPTKTKSSKIMCKTYHSTHTTILSTANFLTPTTPIFKLKNKQTPTKEIQIQTQLSLSYTKFRKTHIAVELLSSRFNLLNRRHGHKSKPPASPSRLIINHLQSKKSQNKSRPTSILRKGYLTKP